MSKQFYFKQFSSACVHGLNMKTVLFNPNIRPSVDLGAMAMKECSAFPKAPALLEPHY